MRAIIKMNMKNLTTILVIVTVVLSTTLLVGRLFDATWAGGDGYVEQGVAVVDGVEYQRGETIETGDGEWLKVTMEDVTVWMYENTQLKLINLVEGETALTTIQGRILIDGNVTMRVRDDVTQLSGLNSYVHYSWLNQIDIEPIDDDFDASDSDAADFYSWALHQNSLPTTYPLLIN